MSGLEFTLGLLRGPTMENYVCHVCFGNVRGPVHVLSLEENPSALRVACYRDGAGEVLMPGQANWRLN